MPQKMVQRAAQKALALAQPPQAHVSPEQPQEHAVPGGAEGFTAAGAGAAGAATTGFGASGAATGAGAATSEVPCSW